MSKIVYKMGISKLHFTPSWKRKDFSFITTMQNTPNPQNNFYSFFVV